jgi:hypothetical protein
MHNIPVINPLCHFFQQPVMPQIVEVGSWSPCGVAVGYDDGDSVSA